MFNIFKTKSEEEKLQKKYENLLKEWHSLSTTNRALSDKKFAEAQRVLEELEALKS